VQNCENPLLVKSNFQYSNRYNSTADCSISLEFSKGFNYMALYILETFKVKESKVEVTA